MPELIIRPAQVSDIPAIVGWARSEEFAPGFGDVDIYRNTDRQGVWVGWLDSSPVGCIAGIKYNAVYGFIGLYICLLYTSPSPRDRQKSRMPSSA